MSTRTSSPAPSAALLEVAAASVPGRRHVVAGRPNQDAFAWRRLGDGLVAAACDGCSSGARSEVGAALGARLVVEEVSRILSRGPAPLDADFYEAVRLGVLSELRPIARALGGGAGAVEDHLLFTVVGAAVARGVACAFALGDGLVVLNGQEIRLGPYEDNAPPYLACALLPGRHPAPAFRLVTHLLETELRSLVIGTDGAFDLAEAASRRLPGRSELLGPLSRLWTEDAFFRNPDALRRHLALASRDSLRVDLERGVLVREAGLLPDDTTLVVIRRRPPAEPVS